MQFWEKPKDVTDDLQHVVNTERAFIQPGQISANISIEECVPGFLFNIISTEDDLTIAMYDKYNKAMNSNIEIGPHDITKILTRWPGVHMDIFRRAPTSKYTALMVYFNQNILDGLYIDYPEEGLYVIDIIPHETGIPLSRKHKEKFAASIGLNVIPLQYNGIMSIGFGMVGTFANQSKISRSNIGHKSRMTFEPRNGMDTFTIRATSENREKIITDTPEILAEELGNFIVNPKRILEVAKSSKWNPKSRYNKFTEDLIQFIIETTGYFSNYYIRALAIDETLTEEVFRTMVQKYSVLKVCENVNQMKQFRFK